VETTEIIEAIAGTAELRTAPSRGALADRAGIEVEPLISGASSPARVDRFDRVDLIF